MKIDYYFAESRYDWLPGLAADLVHRQVAVIVTGATIPYCTRRQGCNHDDSDRVIRRRIRSPALLRRSKQRAQR